MIALLLFGLATHAGGCAEPVNIDPIDNVDVTGVDLNPWTPALEDELILLDMPVGPDRRFLRIGVEPATGEVYSLQTGRQLLSSAAPDPDCGFD